MSLTIHRTLIEPVVFESDFSILFFWALVQVVGTGPVSESGQYEFLVLSNWAKFPVVGLARDLTRYSGRLQDSMDSFLKSEGYTNFLTDVMGTVVHTDWTYCRDAEKSPNIAVDIVNGILFGKKRK